MITFITLFAIQIAEFVFIFNNVDLTNLNFSFMQISLSPHGVNVGRLILYAIVISIVIVTRYKWTKYGRKITKMRIRVESIFFLALSSIVIFDSFYDVGVPISYLILYVILFLGIQHLAYLRSNRLMSLWRDSKSGSIYVKGAKHIHFAYVIGTALRIIISILFIGSLFGPSRQGIIYIDPSEAVFATLGTDLLLLVSVGLLIGLNRRILVRYNLIEEGKEKI